MNHHWLGNTITILSSIPVLENQSCQVSLSWKINLVKNHTLVDHHCLIDHHCLGKPIRSWQKTNKVWTKNKHDLGQTFTVRQANRLEAKPFPGPRPPASNTPSGVNFRHGLPDFTRLHSAEGTERSFGLGGHGPAHPWKSSGKPLS